MNRIAIIPLLILLAGCITVSEGDWNETGPIGGERDAHGCLGPAGYSWNESLGACVREWELSYATGERDAVRTAAATYENHDGLTVIDTEIYRCPGCFKVLFEQHGTRSEVKLSDWAVMTADSCGPCPQFMPPADDMCYGRMVGGDADICGCRGPPRCLTDTACMPELRGVQVCTDEQGPVCGWFNESIQCFAYPCAATFDNPCAACADEKVSSFTEGECPAVAS